MRIFPNPLRVLLCLFLLQASYSSLNAQLVVTPTEVDVPNGKRIDLVVDNFEDIISFQFSMTWDTAAISFDSVTNLNIPGMGMSSFGVSLIDKGIMTTSWFDFFLTGKTVPDGTSMFSLWFSEKNDTLAHCFQVTDTPTLIEVTNKDNEILSLSTSPLCFNLKGATSRFAVFYDLDEDCEWDAGEPLLSSWGMNIAKPGRSYYLSTGSSGSSEIQVDTGAFSVDLIPPSPYWKNCDNSYTFQVDSATLDTLLLAVPAQPDILCPYLEVDISTPSLIACANNFYEVSFCNKGTAAAENSYVEVQLGPNMNLESSSIPAEDLGDGLHRFQLETIGIDSCGSFGLVVQLDLDCLLGSGLAHCVEAQIYPQTGCLPPNPDWAGDYIELDGQCVGTDQIRFTITNPGTGNMQEPATWVIFEDGEIHSSGLYQLDAGEMEEILLSIEGSSYRLETRQVDGFPHPSRPSFGLEACAVASGQPSVGLLPNYPDDDAAPFRSVDCRVSRSDAALNRMEGFPLGEGPQNRIPYGVELEYLISFQNTGDAPVSELIIQDELSKKLDLTTLKVGASSHPYSWSLQPNGRLMFRFENMQLPDSASNPIQSQGFVRFMISPRADLDLGEIIQNRASIQMGQQPALLTNTTFHTLQRDRFFFHDDVLLCEGDSLNGTAYTEPAYLVDVFPMDMTDSIHISQVDILPLSYTETDTLLPFGGEYLGVQYDADTTLMQTYTAANGCDSLVTVNIFVTVDALEEQGGPLAVHISPNPFTSRVNLSWESIRPETVRFRLTNAAGQVFSAGQFMAGTDQSLDFSGVPAGMYFLQLQSDERQKTFKLIRF